MTRQHYTLFVSTADARRYVAWEFGAENVDRIVSALPTDSRERVDMTRAPHIKFDPKMRPVSERRSAAESLRGRICSVLSWLDGRDGKEAPAAYWTLISVERSA